MATNKNLIPIPGRLHSVAMDGCVSGANEIYDDTLEMKQDEVNTMLNSRINAFSSQNYVNLEAEDGDTIADIFEGVTGAVDTIYRVAKWDGSVPEYNESTYSEYVYDTASETFKFMDVKSYGIDAVPTAGSSNVVESGGVADALNLCAPASEVLPLYNIHGVADTTWKNIFYSSNNPIPAGSIIINNGDLTVTLFDSKSTTPGEYNTVEISAGSLVTCEWYVYRIRTRNATGNYGVTVYDTKTLAGRVKELEIKVEDIAVDASFKTGEKLKDVSIVDNLNSQVNNSVPSTTTVKEEFDNVNDELRNVNDTIFGADNTLPTITYNVKKEPARRDGTIASSGYFSRYEVDLTEAYARGYRTVKFYAFSHHSSSNIVQGIIITGINDGEWEVESYTFPANYKAGYCELPITANSTKLIATILTANGKRDIGSRYPSGTDLDYVPTSVTVTSENVGLVERVDDLDDRVKVLEEGGVTPSHSTFPTNYFPSVLYGVIGETQQEFIRGIVASINPYNYYNKFILSPVHGTVYKRYLEITPQLVNGSIRTDAYVKHQIINDNYDVTTETLTPIKITKQSNFVVPQGGINVLCIGASTTNGAQWCGELYRRLTGTGGTPEGYGLQNINFVGRKRGKGNYINIHNEATGGWKWKNFFTPEEAIRFYVSGNPSVDIGTKFTFTGIDENDNVVTTEIAVAEVNVSGVDGEDNIRFIYTEDSPIAIPSSTSGTITSSGGTTIIFVNYEREGYAPFADANGDITFVPYVNQYCNGKLDVLCCFMGSINIPATHNNDLTSTLLDIKNMLDTLHDEYPLCKVLMGTAIPFSTYYGLEEDYGAGSNTRSKYIDALLGAFRYVKMIDDLISTGKNDNNEPYSNFCYLVNTFTEVDSENAFPITTKAANTRMPDLKEVVGTNGAHPTLDGYFMIADSFCRTFANEVLTNNNE